MHFTRSRAALLSAALLTVTLTACAPPGQEGDPGVAVDYAGSAITNSQVDAVYQAWLDDTLGQDVANRRQVLTIELLRPDLLAKCAELGYPVTRQVAEDYAEQWLQQFKGLDTEPSDEVIEATQGILALYIVASIDPSLESLRAISDVVAEQSVSSPRSGAYSTDALLASVQAAAQTADQQQLGTQFSATAYQNVSAFIDEDRSWFDRGTVASLP